MLINKERPSNGGHTYKVDMLINSSLKKPLVAEVGDDIAKIRNIIHYKHCYWYNSKMIILIQSCLMQNGCVYDTFVHRIHKELKAQMLLPICVFNNHTLKLKVQ